ncbi:MAG: Uncharacterized protein XD58_1688 [Thermotoga sp. 50_1627]|uniref:DUF1468 domain-containing protein n=1 Tax=Pseudothermotoga hypogea DSM 11164 = NBRC 106472 TaxID=1123384 RepID=A0A0X1KTZ5_9THEM|nr:MULTISPECIES: tripartite tricarboxylate transporter TctB family protein [Pseudothermotoga]KUK02190.1 MAG: Uncharacterized protein XD45_1692 [Thermotoga sp. 50_64]KUK24326.1 MAG: Uncharacterized protein XD58_1688 [Thermotoga sp. 50_1627]AJC74725.1 hypothetical protein AJ81_04780 [Pseudothermotoga hypogea DSM 11164 = NBRC 106472]MDI6861985.1 tripartite tricarboxylate transporter TctB family protein [Pseudothermotoga sp.]HBT39197.1 tripartite tricarboxylate transporter TctB family protein [Pse
MGDLIFSLVSIAYSIYLLVESSKLPAGIATIPGPGFFPRLIASVILVLACLLLTFSLRRFFKKTTTPFPKGRWAQVSLVLITILLYVLLWGRCNFLLNTFLMLFSIHIVTGSKWYMGLIGSAVLSIGVFLLFGNVFHVLFF